VRFIFIDENKEIRKVVFNLNHQAQFVFYIPRSCSCSRKPYLMSITEKINMEQFTFETDNHALSNVLTKVLLRAHHK